MTPAKFSAPIFRMELVAARFSGQNFTLELCPLNLAAPFPERK
jgi:hypothetical protein